jgi:heparin/heparan-sulfate lyase
MTTTANKTTAFDAHRHPVTTARPRLLGSREDLRKLSLERPEPYRRMLTFARQNNHDFTLDKSANYDLQAVIFGLAIAYVLEGNKTEGRVPVDLVLKHYIDQPILVGHQTFAHDMARCAVAYDLCHDLWTPEEKQRFQNYVHKTIDANVDSETSPFHNGWYGYKNWGYGMAAYALYHDDPRAPEILRTLEQDYLTRAAPALELAGAGGGWGEGYYIHYFLFEWMFFCEVARNLEGLDYYAAAPNFFNHRAVAAMFEFYPALQQPTTVAAMGDAPAVKASELSRRPIPMGDGMGKWVKHERDKTLTTRRMLANLHKNDPTCQAVHAFNQTTPKVAIPCDAYMDFFWNDTSIQPANLDQFKLSHFSPGPGYVYARSSWKDDATLLFFKSGPRFTSHQHLDNGHILLFKNTELLGDGGHYDSWTGQHVVSYYLRTIAHNSILIHDPNESFNVRCQNAGNDGGQAFPWPNPEFGQNGYSLDPDHWHKNKNLLDTGRITAYVDKGTYMYTAGDFTNSYSKKKAKKVTRQIVYLRPDTIVIFDRVESTDPDFRKAIVFQPMKLPEKKGPHYIVTNGAGRLFIQPLSPADPDIQLFHGDTLHQYFGQDYPPTAQPNPAPECRMQISPTTPNTLDHFLTVLTTADNKTQSVPLATTERKARELTVTLGTTSITFNLDNAEASITLNNKKEKLPTL